MSSKFLNLDGLKEALESQNPAKVKEIVESTCTFFDQDLTSAELALAVELLFHDQNGTLAFINKSIRENKRFTDSNIVIFELWAKLIQNHCKDLNFTAYVENVISVCLRYALSTAVSAKEKENSVIVMQEVFRNGLMRDVDASPLVTKLLNILSQKQKQSTFLQEVYKLLGTVARDSPTSIANVASDTTMRDVFLKPLEIVLLNEETIQFNTLTGALQGLSLYLTNFAPSPETEPDICKRIYTCMKRLSDPMDSSKKATFRASIDLFTAHTSLFSTFVFKDTHYWHSCLKKWLSSSVYDDRRKGIYATHAFHQIVADELTRRKDETDRDTLRFFANSFREILESRSSPAYMSRIAIRGFGVMSGPCKDLLPDMLDKLTLLVIQRTELVSIAEDNELRDTLEHFPDYVEALSQIILITDDKQAMEMLVQNVELITIRLMKDFHYLSRAHTQLVVSSLLKSFHNLTKVSGSLLDSALEKVVLSGIIWTCSHKLVYDANLDWSTDIDWKQNITYKSYFPLWEGLIVDLENFAYNRPMIAQQIFDHLMKSLFVILHKLDFRTKRRVYTDEDGTDKEFYFCDPNIDLCPVKPQDFHIFFNVVDFFRDLFWVKFRSAYFNPWIQEFCGTALRLAIHNPLVSGFLKLLEIGLVKADSLHYFDVDSVEVQALRMQLSHFLKHLIAKSQKISGELQISCLELILKYPCHFYEHYILHLIAIFEVALDLGKSLIWLAKLAVAALEKMLELYPENSIEMSKFYKKVLPCLDSYLRSKGFEDNTNSEIVKTRNRRRIRKTTIPKATETELVALQKRIVTFLGKLSPQTATMMILNGNIADSLVKWEMEQSLRVILHFPTMRPSIYLDTIMPRICELALTSSDRKTKVSACELVHAVILYLMGIRKYKGQIWKELCRCMLTLGSDGDGTIQQMFEPLLKQVMHYMSKYDNLEGVESLMEALMNGISNSENSTIRDLSAVCLREFVEWSLKQITPEQLAASPGSIKIILEHLKMYSFDSDGTKRNGAALAFNNLYRVLREQEAICSIYFIDLFHTFCVNFKLSEEFSSISLAENLNSDLEQVSMSLDHLVRVLKERSDIFNKHDPSRIVPSLQELTNMKDVVLFCLSECSSKLLKYRQKIMEIVKVLSIKIPHVDTFSQFIVKYSTLESLRNICEGTVDGAGIKARPNLNCIKNEKHSPHLMIYSWLQHFLSSVDCYCWLFEMRGLDEPLALLENAKILEVISYYLNIICWENASDILNRIDINTSTDSTASNAVINSEEVVKIESIKTIIAIRLMVFFTKAHLAGCADAFTSSYWTDNIHAIKRFVTHIIFEVHKLNFDFRVQNVVRMLPNHIEELMSALHSKCKDRTFITELQKEVLRNLKVRLEDVRSSIKDILHSDFVVEEQQNCVNGIRFVCKHLSTFHVEDDTLKCVKMTAMDLFSDLFREIKSSTSQCDFALEPNSNVKKLANQLMSVCFIVNNMAPNVVHCLLVTDELKTHETTNTVTHGKHFLTVYKTTIFEYCDEGFIQNVIAELLRNITATNFHQILCFLIELVEHLYKTKADNMSGLQAATDMILLNIAQIIKLVSKKNEQLTFTKLIAHLVNSCPYELYTYRHKAPNLENWILGQLKDETISLKTKSNIIYLLPALVGPDDKCHDELTKALECVQRQYIPLRSTEYAKNSLEETALKYVFKYLLDSLVVSKSYVILEFLIKCTAPDDKHVIEWMIREALKSYTLFLSSGQQSLQLNSIFAIICSRDIEPKFRLTILERFELTMIQNCRIEALEEFYTRNIKRLGEMIETNYGSGKSGWIVEHALVDRIVGFSLVEIMFAMLSKENLCSRESPIGREYAGELKTGNELVGLLTKKSFYSRTEVFVTDDSNARELFRQYQCAAYRSVCSLVCNTQTGLQFYSKFMFEENLTKNELIWQKLIDCTNDTLYVFDGQETEEYLKVKQRFVSIRKLNPRPTTSTALPTYSSKQLQTQSVFQSSLSQDVSKLDLNYSTVRTDAEALVQKEKLQQTVASVHLERTVLNKHEVMPTLCGVVEYMFENGISPKPPPGEDKRREYKWISAIASAIENPESHRNIRLFLAQLVQNCRDIFQHYSYALFGPVLQVLVSECAGTRLNFFTTDLIAMLLAWTSKKYYTPSSQEERYLITQLLKFLMKNAWHEKREIFKFNLELVQSVIHLWKDCITIPSQLLFDSITRSQSSDSRENGCGLILVGLILSNDLEIWTSANKDTFFRSVEMNLWNDYTTIYQPASSVVGMMLHRMQSAGDNDFLERRLPELLHRIRNLRSKNEKKFMDIVYGIHKHYPEIVDSFREIITFRIPLALGAIKCIYLEMLLVRIDAYEADDLYRLLISIGIVGILKNLDYQLLGLHILNRAVRKMPQEEIEKILPNIENCTESRKIECRDVAYEILVFIALNCANELGNRAGQLLLNGLMDPEAKIQNRIFHFWSKETNLSQKIEERILFLISDYSIRCEKQFLGFCTQLLLELSIESVESKRQVFEFQNDDDSKLMEYQISTEPQMKNTNSLPPLFAESHNTRRSLLLGSQNYNYVQESANSEYFFEPTLDPGKARTLSQSFSLPTQSALPFIVVPQILGRNSQKIRSQEITEENLDASFNKLRKRFLKNKEKETRHRVLQVIDKRVKQKSKMEEDAKKKQSQVVLYRRYRNGDYPDLLINHLALLLPLQGLVKRDPVIAREVFVSIFSAVLGSLGPEANMFIISVSSKIQVILENAKSCDPMIFATFLEMALLQPAKFDFAPELIAMVAKASNMLTIGAIYLENRINADWDTDLLSAKSSSTLPIDEQHWLHLSDIYNSLAEYDVVSSIFADKMRTDPRLAEAIELKANGKYEKSQELLLEVIERRVQVEHYYAYICYYECFLEMGMWSELSKNVQNQIDDFEELWTDDYNMAFLLPNLMQSELQLILQNKSQSSNFLRSLETWIADPTKSDHIKRVFCEELMMLNIANHDFLQARVYGECYLRAFLMDWSVISSMNNKLRLKNLLNAQKVAEIDRYASILIEDFNEASVERLNARWKRCHIDGSESLQFWNCVIAYRAYIGHLIQDMLGNVNSQGLVSNQLQDVVFGMHLQLFNVAQSQKNYVLSGKILEELNHSESCRRNTFDVQCNIAKIKQAISDSQSSSISHQINVLENTWKMSENVLHGSTILTDNAGLHMEVLKLHATIGEQLLDLITEDRLLNVTLEELVCLSGERALGSVQQYIFEKSLQSLKQAASLAKSIGHQNNVDKKPADCFYKLAQFCYDYYDKQIIENRLNTDLEEIIIENVFMAMKYDSKEARQLFPNILHLPSIKGQQLHTHFSDHSADVPEWMFLSWIPQILSRLDFHKASFLDNIVKRIALSYPNALVYPFNVWYERFAHETQAIISLRAEILDIVEILKSPITEMFIKNFKILCLPEALLFTHLEELSKSISKRGELVQAEFVTKVDQLVTSVFVENQELQGRAYRSILLHKQHISNLRTLNIQNDFERIHANLHKIRESVKSAMQKVGSRIELDAICPWLAHFQWCGEESFLELPGQYEDECHPRVFDHVKIVKFGHSVEVFMSLRRPFRITIYGSNAKSYDFLVKYGDDLKQDQRIQQLLRLMSAKLAVDQNCRNHNLFIRTFQVVPIGQNCGMLSWVFNTLSLQHFVVKALIRRDPDAVRMLEDSKNAYARFIHACRNENRPAIPLHVYGKAAQHYNRNQISANLRNLENTINLEILKMALVDMSVSPDSFYVLRNNFATSLAAMNISNWVLGIGDRHLQNILISTKNATLTGIDFGCTFGCGVRNLPVPELIPFRLTPHLIGVMSPMGTSGIISKCMGHVLRVLRSSRRILMACMEVFVQEPSVNWLSSTRIGSADVESDVSEPWEPRERVKVAERKLLGYNPMHLVEKELRAGIISRYPEYMEAYATILRGHAQFNVRAQLAEEGLTVEQQVRCLIDLASDPAVLGIAYDGFLPWL